MRAMINHAMANDAGLSGVGQLTEDARSMLVALSDGDGRRALSTLEMAASLSEGGALDAELMERAVQRKGLRYDRSGDEHYNLVSALHKSVRNSDPDAALYWLARMIEGGEDPRFIARRLIRIASEDVGLADPWAILQATAAWDAAEKVGYPECDLALAQATVYMACAEKSNALYLGMTAAKRDVHDLPAAEVPLHLRNAPTRMMKELGYGDGYQYAHDSPDHVARMDCLPEALKGRTYYRPKSSGIEAKIAERLKRWRHLRQGPTSGE
jgi:putative ATPase